ncbi:hypothetical protein D9M70_463110 [compost metagenome]
MLEGHSVGGCLQSHPATTVSAGRSLVDQLDASGIQCGQQPHQRVHVAADNIGACLHALDGRDRDPGQFSQLALVDPEKGPGGPQLSSSNHDPTIALLWP